MRVATLFNVAPADVRVGDPAPRPEMSYAHVRAAWVDNHEPPLAVLVETISGRAFCVELLWPDTPRPTPRRTRSGLAEPAIAADAARAMALEAAEAWFGPLPADYVLVNETGLRGPTVADYWFRWERRQGDIILPDRYGVTLDGLTGQVRNAFNPVYEITVPLEAKVTRQEAIGAADEAAEQHFPAGVQIVEPEEVQLEVGYTSQHSAEQHLFWRIVVRGGTPPHNLIDVLVDALTGEVLAVAP